MSTIFDRLKNNVFNISSGFSNNDESTNKLLMGLDTSEFHKYNMIGNNTSAQSNSTNDILERYRYEDVEEEEVEDDEEFLALMNRVKYENYNNDNYPDNIYDDTLIVENNELNVSPINSDYNKKNKEELHGGTTKNVDNDSSLQPFVFFPHYKISDYSNDITSWRKQVNPYGTKGFFFFKIFFNFRTNYGLLGGILNDTNTQLSNTNTAFGYLDQIKNFSMYKSENINDRLNALKKFVNGLYVVSEKTPWFFKEVNNINNINDIPIIEEDFNNQSIDIICSEESVDMRLGTLFNLYKFACYNSLRNKEIIPANLRRFEMSILFMHVPLRIHQTKWKNTNKKTTISEKELNFNKETTQIMSVKMLTFQNCEFDVKSMNDVAEQTSNEMAFDLGKSTIKINYTRVFEHRINEWERFGFGQDGFIFDMSEEERASGDRLNEIANAIEKSYYAPRTIYKYDPNNIRNREGVPVGTDNYFGRNVSSPESLTLRHNTAYYNKKLYDLRNVKFNSDNLYGNFTKVRSIYYLNKLKAGKEGTIDHGSLYGADFGRTGIGQYRKNSDYLNEKLNRMRYGSVSGNLYDYDYGVVHKDGTKTNTPYLTEKLNRLKKGTITGNLYDYDYGVVHKDGTKTNTPYLIEKLNRIKNGGILDIPNVFGIENEFKETEPSGSIIPNDLAIANEFKEKTYNGTEIPASLATPNEFTLKWSADAINNSNNMYAVDGIPSTKRTWFGKLMEGTWQRIKGIYRF